MELRTYYDFADDDYKFLKSSIESGIYANSMGSLAQSICERFVKHLINTYVPVNNRNNKELTDILSTHNLNRLLTYWNMHSEIQFDAETEKALREINGYYFSTKYPGDDCQTLSEEDFKKCVLAIDKCKQFVDSVIHIMSQG